MPKSVFLIQVFPVIALIFLAYIFFYQPCCFIESLAAIATTYAAIVALFKDDYREYKNRPILCIKETDIKTIVGNQTWNRIEVFNNGNGVAKNVSVKIESSTKSGFVPIRLLWTHINAPLKDIQPNDSAFCDVALDCGNAFYLLTEVEPKNGFTCFQKNKQDFRIVVSADNCKAKEYHICIDYPANVLTLKIID